MEGHRGRPPRTRLVWAKKKYGDEHGEVGQAACDQEQHISRSPPRRRRPRNWRASGTSTPSRSSSRQQQTQMGCRSQRRRSSGSSSRSPTRCSPRAGRAAGNVNLYNGVIARIAEENPLLAAQIGTQVQMELQSLAAAGAGRAAGAAREQALSASSAASASTSRRKGETMSEKIAELGEYHPYVQAILGGDDGQRDIAIQAVYRSRARDRCRRARADAGPAEHRPGGRAAPGRLLRPDRGPRPARATPTCLPVLAGDGGGVRTRGQWPDDEEWLRAVMSAL